MALWQSDLRVSKCALWISLLLHGAVMLILLLAPWSPDDAPVWMLLFILVVFECGRCQRRIYHHQGPLALLKHHHLRWGQQEWLIMRQTRLSTQAILLSLRSLQGQRKRLWLMRDSMDEAEWRRLHYCLLTKGRSDMHPDRSADWK